MRVLEINTVYGIGSTGKIVSDLYRMLEKKGDECMIAYARGQAPSDIRTIKIGSKWDVYFHGMMTRLTDRHAMYSRHATEKLVEQIRQYRPDLIHLHNLHGYYLDIRTLFRFLKEYDCPVVWTLHDCWSFTGHCSYYTSANCFKWLTQCEDCPLKEEYPASLVRDNSYENYQLKKELFNSLRHLQLVTPSAWLKEEVGKSFLGSIPCRAVPNGIDFEIFHPGKSGEKERLKEKHGLQNKKVVFGAANVWTKQKGWDDFMKLSEMLSDEYRIVMAGLQEKQIKELPANVTGYPRTTNLQKVADFYRMADVYFNASCQETMGMTTGEAICCGTPVVVYRVTAVPESVGPGCGAVLEPGDIEGAKQAIETICSNREQYVQACIDYRCRFSKAVSNEAYYGIYKEMLEDKESIYTL